MLGVATWIAALGRSLLDHLNLCSLLFIQPSLHEVMTQWLMSCCLFHQNGAEPLLGDLVLVFDSMYIIFMAVFDTGAVEVSGVSGPLLSLFLISVDRGRHDLRMATWRREL